MDRIAVCGTVDPGSIPGRRTRVISCNYDYKYHGFDGGGSRREIAKIWTK